MTALTLSGLISAATLSTIMTLGRSGANAVGYLTIDHQTAKALRFFAQDARMASNLIWNSATSVTLVLPDKYSTTGNCVTYAWDNTPGSATYHCFYRMPGDAGAANSRTVLAHQVTTFSFVRYDRLNATTTQNNATKRLELTMSVGATQATGPSPREDISASFILRNKPLS
jgi:hypothetical protein